ncbi:MAG: GTPase ObgE [Bacteroidales bacterium]|nr:GTPase ObgE [Bacteroidales bacterium]
MSNPNFIDYVKIHCQSGKGGPGSAHFFRSRTNPRGGPDGGDGGRGGHIILRGNSQLWTLLHLKYSKHVKAGNGMNGGGQLKSGADGKDNILEVPLGTVAKDAETGNVEFEITKDGETKILLKGGRGGLGNDHFKSPTNRAPKYAQPGESGQEFWKILELKLLADVGLVGFPNAGKSTLLSKVSDAHPKIADYRFTTLEPSLGVVQVSDYESFVMADIPGIIEGAHDGKGLGDQFLRHIQRTKTLLFLIDVNSNDPFNDYQTLKKELHLYDPYLDKKSHVIILSKIDTIPEEDKFEMLDLLTKEFESKLHEHISTISSVSGENLNKLKRLLFEIIKKYDKDVE